jgi:hypothetical protein
MAAYLLHPNRGPGQYNIDSFALVISHVENPIPFERRWIDWINDGYFDREDKAGSEPAETLYQMLNDRWDSAKFSNITRAIQDRVHLLMKSRSRDDMRGGMHHLISMVAARYRGSDYILEHTLDRSFDLDAEEQRLLQLLKKALSAVVAYQLEPSEKREVSVRDLYSQLANADQARITGYFESRT